MAAVTSHVVKKWREKKTENAGFTQKNDQNRTVFVNRKRQTTCHGLPSQKLPGRVESRVKCIHGCWLKQLVSPNLNTISLVYVRAFN